MNEAGSNEPDVALTDTVYVVRCASAQCHKLGIQT